MLLANGRNIIAFQQKQNVNYTTVAKMIVHQTCERKNENHSINGEPLYHIINMKVKSPFYCHILQILLPPNVPYVILLL